MIQLQIWSWSRCRRRARHGSGHDQRRAKMRANVKEGNTSGGRHDDQRWKYVTGSNRVRGRATAVEADELDVPVVGRCLGTLTKTISPQWSQQSTRTSRTRSAIGTNRSAAQSHIVASMSLSGVIPPPPPPRGMLTHAYRIAAEFSNPFQYLSPAANHVGVSPSRYGAGYPSNIPLPGQFDFVHTDACSAGGSDSERCFDAHNGESLFNV